MTVYPQGALLVYDNVSRCGRPVSPKVIGSSLRFSTGDKVTIFLESDGHVSRLIRAR